MTKITLTNFNTTNYHKLLEDYLNKSVQYAYDNYEVLSWNEVNGQIEVYLSYGNDYRNTFTVSLFELLSFVYSFLRQKLVLLKY